MVGRRGEAHQAGAPAVRAVIGAVEQFVDMFTQLGGLMAERVTDLRDIRDRVIAELKGLPEPGVPVPDRPSILCAEDLAPADTAGLDPALVVALATTLGGPTSHTAIIARQLGIPCVVAVEGLDARRRRDDGARRRHPRNRHRLARRRRSQPRPSPRHSATPSARPTGPGPARPPTDTRWRCWPTCRTAPRRRAARETPAEGVGLFRTELCFLNRDTEPSVDEQADIYAEVLDAFAGTQGGHQDPRRRLGQTPEVRRASRRGQPRARRAGHPHRRRQPRVCWTASSRPSPTAGQRTGNPAVGDGADDRDRG